VFYNDFQDWFENDWFALGAASLFAIDSQILMPFRSNRLHGTIQRQSRFDVNEWVTSQKRQFATSSIPLITAGMYSLG
jgi:hypothetical protein